MRISLQPTFSPTPPALDEDDEEYEAGWASWDERHEHRDSRSGSGARSHAQENGNGRADRGRRANGSAKGGEDEVDVWADSSEEDEEYRRARRLLMRIGKKEREKGKGRA